MNRFLLAIFLFFPLWAQVAPQGQPWGPTDPKARVLNLGTLLSDQEKRELIHRLLEKEPFSRSWEAVHLRSSLGHYFGLKDYEALSGNMGLGYYQAPESFRWLENVRAVEFDLKGVDASTKRIRPEACAAAMQIVARKYGLEVVPQGKGLVKIKGAIVRFEPREKYPEVTLELQIQDPRGVTIRYRKSEARPTAGDSLGALLDFIVGFARRFGASGGANGTH